MERIRIEWGGCIFYYLNIQDYIWDGGVIIKNGVLKQLYKLKISPTGHGIKRDRSHPIPGCSWHSHTHDSVDGIMLDIEGNDDTFIKITTTQLAFNFTLKEIKEERYIRYPVGDKYSGISLAVILDNEGPFDVNAKVAEGSLDCRLKSADFKGANYYGRWQCENGAWLKPGGICHAKFNLKRSPYVEEHKHSFMTLDLRLAIAENPEKDWVGAIEHEGVLNKYSAFQVKLNGRILNFPPVLFRRDSSFFLVQFLEFVEIDVPPEILNRNNNVLEIINDGENLLVITGAQLREKIEQHGEIIYFPNWLLSSDEFNISIRLLHNESKSFVRVKGAEIIKAPNTFKKGLVRLTLKALKNVYQVKIAIGKHKVIIPVYKSKREKVPWLVGAVVQNIKHDSSGELERILYYMADTQIGNYVQFRMALDADRCASLNVSPECWKQYIRLCVELKMFFSMNSLHCWRGRKGMTPHPERKEFFKALKIMKDFGENYFFSCHIHEFVHWLYVYAPGVLETGVGSNGTMRNAMEQYLNDIAAIETAEGIPRQSGQATPLVCYDYAAGIDIPAIETMAYNASILFAGARGAAKAFNKERWGVYNAVYWCKLQEDFSKLSLSYINYYLTYLWGGNMAISEDGHFRIFHSGFQQGIRSEETTAHQMILRDFYRFVNICPRHGKPQVDIAVAQGNLSAEIAAVPWNLYRRLRVWGSKGGVDEKWLCADPEQGMELIDVFMPYSRDGVNIRHWFTGTPYGQFDLTPIAYADQNILDTYKLLVFLGWNSMEQKIMDKLERYVENGGTLFMSLPHLSTHEGRNFIENMKDLALINDGDYASLFGLKVKKKGNYVKGEVRWKIQTDYFPYWKSYTPAKIALTNLELNDAEILIEDTSGTPLLVRHRLGKGVAYLLTTWAFPGNSEIHELIRDILHGLGRSIKEGGSVALDDPSNEVAWSVWKDETDLRDIHLLNTDWTELGNEKECRLRLGECSIPVVVKEREFNTVTWLDDLAIQPQSDGFYVKTINKIGLNHYLVKVHGHGKMQFNLFILKGKLNEINSNNKEFIFKYNSRKDLIKVTVDFKDSTSKVIKIKLYSESVKIKRYPME